MYHGISLLFTHFRVHIGNLCTEKVPKMFTNLGMLKVYTLSLNDLYIFFGHTSKTDK